MVEIGERNDQAHVVLGDELRERVDVARVVDPRRERAAVGVVERRRERVEVDRDRRRAGAGEGGDDVDALARAREEDRSHADERSRRQLVQSKSVCRCVGEAGRVPEVHRACRGCSSRPARSPATER